MKCRFPIESSCPAAAAALFKFAALLLTTCLLLLVGIGSVKAAAGDLDPTFGNAGRVTTSFFDSDVIWDSAVQVDGKIVVVGNTRPSRGYAVIARYKLDGTLDASFGSNGHVFPSLLFDPFAVVIQPDHKIVAGGAIDGGFGVARFNPDGSLDSTFGVGGAVTIRFPLGRPTDDKIWDLALQSDGKIVAAGDVDDGHWFALARFNADGTLDTTFGQGGEVMPGMSPGIERAFAVAVQADSKIVALGEIDDSTGVSFALARFKANGDLDETFGTGGRVFTNFDTAATGTSLVIQPDQRIIAAGFTGHQFALARYLSDGTLDPSFEIDGKVITFFNGDGACTEIALQKDGKIVAAGRLTTPAAGVDFILTRYNSNGELDNTFGTLGKVVTDFGSNEFCNTVVVQPDDKIVAAGQGLGGFALARYSTAPTNSPVLRTESGSNHALALDSVTFLTDPFSVTNDLNFSADHRTRIILFATNLTLAPGEPFSSVSVKAEDAGGGIHDLPVEYAGVVPGFEWVTQVVVKLPDSPIHAGNIQVSINHGNTSNKAAISIK